MTGGNETALSEEPLSQVFLDAKWIIPKYSENFNCPYGWLARRSVYVQLERCASALRTTKSPRDHPIRLQQYRSEDSAKGRKRRSGRTSVPVQAIEK